MPRRSVPSDNDGATRQDREREKRKKEKKKKKRTRKLRLLQKWRSEVNVITGTDGEITAASSLFNEIDFQGVDYSAGRL